MIRRYTPRYLSYLPWSHIRLASTQSVLRTPIVSTSSISLVLLTSYRSCSIQLRLPYSFNYVVKSPSHIKSIISVWYYIFFSLCTAHLAPSILYSHVVFKPPALEWLHTVMSKIFLYFNIFAFLSQHDIRLDQGESILFHLG